MAGAGYKLFNTGDVLTAAQVNTYLMQQTIMVFADSTARTTALSGVLAEGMTTYLQDTNSLEFWNGSAWVAAVGDITGVTAGTGLTGGGTSGTVTLTNDMAVTITAKGDLIAGTGNATYDNLAAGSNGDSLVADSAATTGLRWQGNFAAGKNAIINGDFRINQRNFTSNTTNDTFNFDRWKQGNGGGTVTVTPQTFTPGSAPVSGYEAVNFVRIATSGQSTTSQYALLETRLEDVRLFAGQTVTLSFWAKANSGTPFLWMEYQQNFGSGGSGTVFAQAGTTQTISTSWARYSVTFNVPSISGKTIGTGSHLAIYIFTSLGSAIRGYANATFQNNTIDIWGVQLEAGSVSTSFQTATGTIQGELAACQRYYQRYTGGSTVGQSMVFTGTALSQTIADIPIVFAVPMRVAPTSADFSNLGFYNYRLGGTYSSGTWTYNNGLPYAATMRYTHGTNVFTVNDAGVMNSATSAATFVGFSAEL